MKKLLLFYLFFCSSFELVAQDNLRQIEANYSKYKELVNSDTDAALTYILKAQELNNAYGDLDWHAKISYGIGHSYALKQNFQKALTNFENAIQYSDKTNNINIKSMSYNQIGLIHAQENNFKTALYNYHQSLKISESKEELSENTMSVYSNIADLYILQKDTLSARKNYHFAQRIGERDNKKNNLAVVYNNIAVSYMNSNIDSTEYYLNKALQIYHDTHNTYGQTATQINLATSYMNFKSKKDYPKALNYLKEALELSKVTKNTDNEFFSYLYLGNYYEQAEADYLRARSYYEEAYKILKQGHKNDYAVELYRFLSRVNSKLGDYQKAYTYLTFQHELQDSIFSVERNKQFVEIQTKYEVDKKNSQIQLLEKEKEIQKGHKRLILIGAFSLIIPLLLISIFFRIRLNYQKTIRTQDQLLFEKEKETISAKNLIKGQNLERKRIANELHDGVGGRLSAIKIKMDQLNTTHIKNVELQACINQLQDTAKEIRIISHTLKNHKITESNFVILLQHLVEEYKFYFSGDIELSIYPEEKFELIDGHKKHYLFRTIQEVLNNCLKYAKANTILIDCTFDEVYRILIEDNGIGFSLKDTNTKKGMGLSNLAERVKELEGNIHIDSSPGRGTTIIIEIPT